MNMSSKRKRYSYDLDPERAKRFMEILKEPPVLKEEFRTYPLDPGPAENTDTTAKQDTNIKTKSGEKKNESKSREKNSNV